MASTWTIAGIALGPTGPVNGATIYAWKAQRFATAPAQNAAAPTGSADAGPVTSGTVYGGPGAYNIQCPTNEAYYIAVTYNAITYWTYVNELNFTDMVESTVAVASNNVSLTTLAAGTSLFGSTTGMNTSGRINVTTSGGQAVLAYTSITGGGSPSFNSISIISGTGAWTVATGGAITQAQQFRTLNQIFDDGAGNVIIAGTLVAGAVGSAATFQGGIVSNLYTQFNGAVLLKVTTKNTSALPYTTLSTDVSIALTGSTASTTLTLGTTNFQAGQVQTVLNESSVLVTLAAASGATDLTSLPPNSGAFMQFDGTNWECVGGYGLNQDSSSRATFSVPTPSTGVAFQPAANADCMLYIKCTTSTTIVVTQGPSTGAEHSIVPSVVAPVGALYSVLVPKNWKVVVTGTIADFVFIAQTL